MLCITRFGKFFIFTRLILFVTSHWAAEKTEMEERTDLANSAKIIREDALQLSPWFPLPISADERASLYPPFAIQN
jgi:hypothetical protein